MSVKQCVSTPTRTPCSRTNPWRDDPFASGKSFPVFEDAIRTETTIDESTLLDESGADGADSSVCSYASTDMLNLSIGARAALDEHLRHVAKFGIDDSHCLEKSGEHDCSFEMHHKDPRDVLWQKLVDPNFSNNNATNNSTHLLSRDMLRLISKASSLQSAADRNQDFEAFNDQSSDYFNSSRVYLLKTPERNLSQRANAVTCRNEEEFLDTSSAPSKSPADFFRYNTDSHLLAESEKRVALPSPCLPRNDHSFVFSAVDLSRISDDGSDDLAVKRSPITSVASRLREQRTSPEDIGAAFSLLRESHQSAQCVNSSPSVSPFKDTPTKLPPKTLLPLHSENLFSGYHQRNEFDFAENLNFSPIGSRSRQTTPSSKLLHSPTRNETNKALSPPFSTPHDDHISSMLAEYCSTSRGASNSDLSPSHNSLSEKPSRSDSPESSSSAFLLRDRRLFRTVVPTRVFFTDSDDFPEEYDSFSVPSMRGGAQQSDSTTFHTISW